MTKAVGVTQQASAQGETKCLRLEGPAETSGIRLMEAAEMNSNRTSLGVKLTLSMAGGS